ncbi:copper chaperone PCu(A)C [Candidatus Viridilinea mediisalina]|uniref:Copper chaperone PCu(A)C n=1 Tax=Candidatus Viridilinea mediisalina TaxID=2024553 RepID=A0A2A6RII1_9CHLR|nr:copper chaperone PCu(A)C [Candidatus Viridilinea mediisalina]PDW02751.1 hypothetical protein CJ255_12335 [Candidatus Viridilinea mediisalina]
MLRIQAIIITLLAALALAACAEAPTTAPAPAAEPAADAPSYTLGDLTLTDPWIRPRSQAEVEAGPINTGGYLLISNQGSEPDFLIDAAAGDLSEVVELHTMVMDGDVMRMDQIERIEIPAGGTTELRPGGLHVMFIGLNRGLEPGDIIKLNLTFERSGTIEVDAVVRTPPQN